MAFGNYGGDEDKLEFRQIVLAHIKRILEISSHELRDTTRCIQQTTHTQVVEQEDTRYSYIQAIENLAYVLIPYFDERMQKEYDECIKIIDGLVFEVMEQLKDRYEQICEITETKVSQKGFALEMKISSAKKLFRELNQLLKRVDYLKSAVFGETDDETIEDEEED